MRKFIYAWSILPVMLCGCGTIHRLEDQESLHMVGADEISATYQINKTNYTFSDALGAAPESFGAIQTKSWLGAAAVESIGNCNKFLARLGVLETGTDTLLDLTALGASGAAAVSALPATTVAALSAASAFATGTRATIDADIYGKTTAPLIVQEVRNTYYPDIKSYIDKLQTEDVKQSDLGAKYAELLKIHQSCSLQAAVADISSKGGTKSSSAVFAEKDITTGGAKTYTLANGEVVKVAAPGAAPVQTLLVTFGSDSPVKISPTFLVTLLNSGQATLNK